MQIDEMKEKVCHLTIPSGNFKNCIGDKCMSCYICSEEQDDLRGKPFNIEYACSAKLVSI